MRRIAETVEFEVGEDQRNLRLDRFLALSYPDLSRTYIKRLVEEGFVLVNGEEVRKPSRRVRPGEKVALLVPEPEPLEIKPEPIPLEIVYEDRDVAVVIKPCGMVVHPSPGHTSGTLVNALLYHLKDLSKVGGAERPGIVHRLDKETTGLLVVAKNDTAHRELARQFAERRTEKVYRVMVKGLPDRDHMVIEAPVGRHPVHRKKFSVFSRSPKPALTEVWVLKRFTHLGVSLLKVRIHTGRTHQIRVHLSSVGLPVLGDRTYGYRPGPLLKDIDRLMGNCNMLLAYRLCFYHPSTGRWLEFEIEDPEPFRSVLRAVSEKDDLHRIP
jgi:23S rRNA pseudouridine1911/1915/1917 synthase